MKTTDEKNKYIHVTHEFEPLFDERSEILILGSIPSPKSREQAFYYGHPQNRFWKVMAAVLNENIPETIEEKKQMMAKHHIALWDSLEECDIIGASDSSIRNPVPTDIPGLIRKTKIKKVFATGTSAYKFYQKFNYPLTGIEAVKLPSTSPANAACSFDKLVESYQVIFK
ncbi:MAG: DNA-deoxyinosine glycosylase [Lachnospiraceae bacterium]|nr:DNA-deoxyinosine glycosylase [Lachnospiraceae bacterium]